MKTPRELADSLRNRQANSVVRETFRLPRSEARRRVKQLFDDFPSAAYMTEIETCQELPDGVVELTVRRQAEAIDDS